MNFRLRIGALRSRLWKLGCDALVISHGPNVRYLCGFTGSSGALLLTRNEAIFFTDFRYQTQAAGQIGDAARVVIGQRGLWEEILKTARRQGVKNLGVEAAHVSYGQAQELAHSLRKTRLVAVKDAPEKLRLHKDDGELEIIREAVRINDETFAEILDLVRPGASEAEIALAIEVGIRKRGGSGTSFQAIVASGTRSALPHGVASEKLIENGDLLTIDMGAIWDGYCSDMTRTVNVGKAAPKAREIYDLVYRAQVAASDAMRPGISCVEADKIARDIISEAGFGAFFGHGLGHGVGMDIHEAPRVSYLGKGKLAAGQIVTCEPGVYLEGFGGVRIEDMLHITQNGAQILTQTPKPATLLEI